MSMFTWLAPRIPWPVQSQLQTWGISQSQKDIPFQTVAEGCGIVHWKFNENSMWIADLASKAYHNFIPILPYINFFYHSKQLYLKRMLKNKHFVLNSVLNLSLNPHFWYKSGTLTRVRIPIKPLLILKKSSTGVRFQRRYTHCNSLPLRWLSWQAVATWNFKPLPSSHARPSQAWAVYQERTAHENLPEIDPVAITVIVTRTQAVT